MNTGVSCCSELCNLLSLSPFSDLQHKGYPMQGMEDLEEVSWDSKFHYPAGAVQPTPCVYY